MRLWDESQQAQSEKLFDGQRQLEDLSTEELADMGLVDYSPDGGVTFNGPKTDFQEGWVSGLVEAADAANSIVLRQNYEQRLSESINRAFGGTDRAEDLARQDGGARLSFSARGENQFVWNGVLDELAPVLRETLKRLTTQLGKRLIWLAKPVPICFPDPWVTRRWASSPAT